MTHLTVHLTVKLCISVYYLKNLTNFMPIYNSALGLLLIMQILMSGRAVHWASVQDFGTVVQWRGSNKSIGYQIMFSFSLSRPPTDPNMEPPDTTFGTVVESELR